MSADVGNPVPSTFLQHPLKCVYHFTLSLFVVVCSDVFLQNVQHCSCSTAALSEHTEAEAKAGIPSSYGLMRTEVKRCLMVTNIGC